MRDRTVLVDGDIVVYRCAFAAEHTVYTLWSSDGQNVLGVFNKANDYRTFVKEKGLKPEEFEVATEKVVDPLSHALANVKSVMTRILAEGNNQITFLSQGKCFRNEVATLLEYKANRKDAPKPVYYDEVREYLIKHYQARVVNALEADDALALMQSDDTVIASIDKDLLQVPGLHYNWVDDSRMLITPEVGLKKKYMQVLTGDATDNIPGIFRLGAVSARGIIAKLTDEAEMYDACLKQWEKYLATEQASTRLGIVYDAESESYMYTDARTGDTTGATAQNIVDEICALITVGGNDAKEVAERSGEAVLLARAA